MCSSKMWKVVGMVGAGLALLTSTVARAQEVGVVSDGAAFTGSLVTVPPVQITGGGGWFTYDSIVSVCFSGEVAETGVETPAGNVGVNCHAHATGTFVNIVCGTGWAGGTGSVAGDSTNFVIDFVATIGLLVGTLGDTPGEPGDITPEELLGVVQLVPGPLAPPPNCFTGFMATVIVVTLECTPFIALSYPLGTVPPVTLGPVPPQCSVIS